MALEVGIVGPSGSGKTSLFTALTKTGGGEYGKTNVGMAPIADERLRRSREIVKARKITPATIRVQDVPGSGAAQLGNLRQVDALLVVLRGFGAGADAGRRPRDLQARAARRRPRPRRAAARAGREAGEVGRREAARRGWTSCEKVLAHVDAGGALADYAGELPGELEPLTTKPLIAIVNGPGGIDLKLEAELAELPDEEAAAFRDGGESALDDIAGGSRDALDLITFFTAGEQDTRAWTLRNGETALDAAGAIHTDIARGFIRCEVVELAGPRRARLARRGREAGQAGPRGQDLRRRATATS